jgi:hypothetical protein
MADATELHENIQEARERPQTKWIGVWIAVLAVLLAVTGMGGSNAAKDMLNANVEVTNKWAQFQAKTIRQTDTRLALDRLESDLLLHPNMPEPARKDIESKIQRYKTTITRYDTDPKENDGRKELSAQARALETDRAKAQRKDPYFDFAEALLQIAIVLASVTIITGAVPLLIGSLGVGTLGALLMLNGFMLWFKIGLLEH